MSRPLAVNPHAITLTSPPLVTITHRAPLPELRGHPDHNTKVCCDALMARWSERAIHRNASTLNVITHRCLSCGASTQHSTFGRMGYGETSV